MGKKVTVSGPPPATDHVDHVLKKWTRSSRAIFILSGLGFIFFLAKYFLIQQFTYTGMYATAGTDYIVYYLGPIADKVLQPASSAYNLEDFRSVVSQGLVPITHPNSAYSLWALRSAEGTTCLPTTFLMFKYSLSLLPLWLSLNLWVILSAAMLMAVGWWSGGKAARLSGMSLRSERIWRFLTVSFLVFGFAPCLGCLGLGAINGLVLFLAAISLFSFLKLSPTTEGSPLSKGRRVWLWTIGPLSLALAIGIKIIPVFFLMFLTVAGLWNVRKTSVRELLESLWTDYVMRYAILTFLCLALITGGTVFSLGTRLCLEWYHLALPRALHSPPVMAPADVPDLSNYLIFLERANVLSHSAGMVIKLVVGGLLVFFAVRASRIQARPKTEDNGLTALRLWLGSSFWSLAMYSWTFMRFHYLVFAVLIFPPLVAAAFRIRPLGRKAAILAMAAIGFVGSSHPIPFFLIHGEVTNYRALYSYPVNWYNLLVGYPPTLLLAAAVWLAFEGLRSSVWTGRS